MNFTNIFSNINPKEVLKNLPDAVLVIESDGKIVWANDKASIIFEAKSSNLKEIYFDDIVVNGLKLAEKSYSKRNSIVTGAVTPEGKEFFVEMNAKKYVEQYFITIRDVTAMTNVLTIAERTGRLNKEKNVMFVKLSNEIKSPIQSIIGFSQALLDGLGGDITDKQSKYVKIINKNSNELLYFMDKFLEFAQAESSLFSTEKQSFDIINAIQYVIKNNETAFSNKNIEVNFDYEALEKRIIFGDENNLKRALQDIIETSIKLTDVGAINIKIDYPEFSTVENAGIKIENPEMFDSQNFIHIAIKDTGMGLSDNEMDGIFEPYTQLDKTNKKNIIRSIALGAAYTIVKRMGGSINVESEVMKGSTFHVIIPIEKEFKS